MRAGKLRTRVTFQAETQIPDGGGGYQIGWGNDKVVFCEYISQSAKEQIESGRIEASTSATLRARGKSTDFLTPSWRAVFDGYTWNVKSVAPFGQRDRRTDIVIERGVAV